MCSMLFSLKQPADMLRIFSELLSRSAKQQILTKSLQGSFSYPVYLIVSDSGDSLACDSLWKQKQEK